MGSYRLYVPPSYDGSTAVAVVINMHGLGSNKEQQEFYTGLNDKAAEPGAGFIVVTPDGNTIDGGIRHWNATMAGPPERDDVQFLSELIDQVESKLCIDASRVYSTGMSNGALMSSRLACSLSNKIAAIAPVAGAYYPPIFVELPDETCPDTRPVPVIAFHGTNDTTVPFNGGNSPYGVHFRLAIDSATQLDVIESWAMHNNCDTTRQFSSVTPNVNLVQYTGCTDNAIAELYRVEGGTHTWPDATIDVPNEVTTHEISANDLMWDFFQQHPLGPKSAPATPTPKNPDGDTDGDAIVNSLDDDDDSDGCLDTRESQVYKGGEMQGARRDPHYFWDFYDVWSRMGPSGPWMRDKTVNVPGDILGVASRFGSMRPGGAPPKATALAEALTPPVSSSGYHTAFDRGIQVGPNYWNLAPPDGSINIPNDVLGVAKQFGHNCL